MNESLKFCILLFYLTSYWIIVISFWINDLCTFSFQNMTYNTLIICYFFFIQFFEIRIMIEKYFFKNHIYILEFINLPLSYSFVNSYISNSNSILDTGDLVGCIIIITIILHHLDYVILLNKDVLMLQLL